MAPRFGSHALKAAEGIVGGLDGLFTSDEERLLATQKLAETLQRPDMMQHMVNLAETKHKSLFVAGWRPAIGWLCVVGLGYSYIAHPIVNTILVWVQPDLVLPKLDAQELFNLTLTMLGFGGLRSYEKIKGILK